MRIVQSKLTMIDSIIQSFLATKPLIELTFESSATFVNLNFTYNFGPSIYLQRSLVSAVNLTFFTVRQRGSTGPSIIHLIQSNMTIESGIMKDTEINAKDCPLPLINVIESNLKLYNFTFSECEGKHLFATKKSIVDI